MPKKVLLVDDDDILRKMTGALLAKQGFEVVPIENGPKTIEYLKTNTPDIILLDVMMPDMDGFTVCREIRTNPATARIPIIMLTALDSVENKLKGFEVGADDYLAKPCDIAELTVRINLMIRRAEASQPKIMEPVTMMGREPARTIAVYSLRGGSGVSTIAVNLAAGLSQLWAMQVALVDMVPVAGQSALFLNQSLRNTWADLCIMEVVDEEAVLSAMLPHESRVRTLASPRRPEESELLTPEKVKITINILRSAFPYVVLDMPHDLSERSLTALDQSDVILIIAQPEIASLRAASMAIETFEALKYNEQKKIYIILNLTFPRKGLAFKDIERMLKSKIDLTLPYAPDEFVTALNVGNPPVLSDPEGPLGAIFEDMAMVLSKDSQRNLRPEQPTLAWRRVAERARKKKSG
jgi:pilus assembly protein CpaE